MKVEIEIDIRKSARENAADYYESAKKARKKAESAKAVLFELECGLEELRLEGALSGQAKKTATPVKPRTEWFEKFRWFVTSEGLLAVGGRDAEQNEAVVKRHMGDGDLVFHADLSGSPFVILKEGATRGGEKSLEETARFTASYSSAWKAGLGGCEVYWIKPEQVSKKAPAGEYVARGSFMIYGKKNYFHRVPLETAVGWDPKSRRVVYGPMSALAANGVARIITLKVGETEQNELAKKIKKMVEEREKIEVPLEGVQKALPPGKSRIAQ